VTRRVMPVNGLRRAVAAHLPFGQVDLVHGLDVDLPVAGRAPLVTTIHDLAPFDAPWCMSRHRAFGERLITRGTIRRADVVIAVSAFTASRIHDLFSRDAVCIPLAVSSTFSPASPHAIAAVSKRYRLPPRFVLQVGTIEPRKDVALLAAACREVGVPLVLAGVANRKHPKPSGSVSLGYVPFRDLAPLYGAATIVTYISRYEGFGLPPLEAMACSAPVVCTDVASLKETVGDGARIVPRGDVTALGQVLRTLLCDNGERAELAAAGRRRAVRRQWIDVARETAKVYASLGACRLA